MSRTTKNVLHNLLGQSLLLVIGLVSTKLMVGNLSKEVFGLISFALLLNNTIAAVIISGIGFHLVRDISQHLEADRPYVEQLLQTSSLIYLGCAVVAGVLLWFAAPWITSHWLHFESLSVEAATNMLRILGISVLLAIPTTLYNAVLRGMERMRTTNLIDVGRSFITQAGLVGLLVNGASAYLVASWIVFANLLGMIAYLVVLARRFQLATFAPVLHMPVLRRNLHSIRDFSILSIAGLIQRQADRFIVSALLPVAYLGYYNFAYQLIERPTYMRAAVSTALYPSLARLSAEKADDRLQRQYHIWFDLISLGLVPIFAAALYITVPLFGYIFDAHVAQLMIVPMMLLTVGTLMNVIQTVPHVTAMAVGRPDITARANVNVVLGMLPLTYLLTWRFGLLGASITWPLYHVFMYLAFVPGFCRECLAMPIHKWYAHTLQILLAAVLPYGLGYAATVATQTAGDWRVLAGVYLAASALFAALAYRIASPEFRTTVIQTLRRLPKAWQTWLHSARPAHRPQG